MWSLFAQVDAQDAGLAASIVVNFIALYVAFKKDGRADERGAAKQWKLYASAMEDRLKESEAEHEKKVEELEAKVGRRDRQLRRAAQQALDYRRTIADLEAHRPRGRDDAPDEGEPCPPS